MQLRSGKLMTKSQKNNNSCNNMNEKIEIMINENYYNRFNTIISDLLKYFKQMSDTENKFEKIKIATTVFELINSRIVELLFLNGKQGYSSITKLYTSIKNRIPELIDQSYEMIKMNENMESEKIESITKFLQIVLKVRNKFNHSSSYN